MKLKVQFVLGGALLAGLPVLVATLVLAYQSAVSGERALSAAAEQRLALSRDITAGAITQYFSTIQQQVLALAHDRMIVEAMGEFDRSYRVFSSQAANLPGPSSLRSSVADYYADAFSRSYREANNGGSAPLRDMQRDLDADVLAMQFAYIMDNPHPLGEKHLLDFRDDGSDYARAHRRYHPAIRDFLQRFEYYDIFLVSPRDGRIVYSVFKELDYATSLVSGPYASSGIGRAYAEASRLSGDDAFYLTDFAPYTPSYEAQASFIAAPIRDQGALVGVLIFQMPVGRINAVMTHDQLWREAGFGDSGETYLVAADGTLRSLRRGFVLPCPLARCDAP